MLNGTAAVALVMAYGQWQRLQKVQEHVAAQLAAANAQVIEARTLSQQAQALAQQAATRASLSEARINEYTLQRSHLEQLAFELSRTREDTMLIDMEASLRLAQQQAQLTGLADPLIAALRNARQRVERTDPARYSAILSAIDRDLAQLTSSAVTDTAGLLGRIDTLLLQLEYLPLANSVGQAHTASAEPPVPGAAPSTSASADTLAEAPLASDSAAQNAGHVDAHEASLAAAPAAQGGGAQPPAGDMPTDAGSAAASSQSGKGDTLQRLWAGVRATFEGLIRVQRIDHPEAALLSQEQAFFLRENIRLQLMNARMGLLARQTASARADLAAVQALVLRYYDLDAPRTRHALRTLQQLQDHILSVQAPAITETLTAIAAAQRAREAQAAILPVSPVSVMPPQPDHAASPSADAAAQEVD